MSTRPEPTGPQAAGTTGAATPTAPVTATARTTTRPPAPGRVLGALLVVNHFLTWYRRNWRGSVVSSVLQPLLFLVAFGVGFGALLGDRPAAADATGGVPYLVWLAPALLAVTAVQGATFESTYPVLSGFKWHRGYHAVVAGPVRPGQIVVGHVAWVALKTAFTGGIYVAIVTLFGAVVSVGILGALVVAVLAAAAVAAAVTAFSATVRNEGAAFNTLFRFVLIPMTLVSGTFFPVDSLPAAVRPVAWVLPLWHATELSRAAALDQWQPLAALGHTAYLVAMLAVGLVLAARHFTRRLTP